MSSEFNFTEIHDALTRHFNLDEMRTLCAKLGVPYEEVGSPGTPTGNARELIYWLDRRGRLRELEPFISGVKVSYEGDRTDDPNTRTTAAASPAKPNQAGVQAGVVAEKSRRAGRKATTPSKSSHAPRPRERTGAGGARRRAPGAPAPAKTGRTRLLAASCLGPILLAFFIWAFVYAPDQLPHYKQRILAVTGALLCGFFTFFLTGAVTVRGKSPRAPLGVPLGATGGVAVFVLVLLWWLTPFAPVAAVKTRDEAPPPAQELPRTHRELTAVPLVPLTARSRVNSVALDDDGARALVAEEDGMVQVWRVGAGRQARKLQNTGQGGAARSVALGADGELIAVGGADGKVRLWRKSTSPPAAELSSHSTLVFEVYLSRDGRRLVTTGAEGNVKSAKMWDIRDKVELLTSFNTPDLGDDILAVSPDLQNVAIYSSPRRRIELWSIQDNKFTTALESSDIAIEGGGTFSQDGVLFAAGSADGTVRLWRSADGKRAGEFKGANQSTVRVALHPTGRMVAAAFRNGGLQVWSTGEPTVWKALERHEQFGYGLAFSANGRVLASGGGDGKVLMWEIAVTP